MEKLDKIYIIIFIFEIALLIVYFGLYLGQLSFGHFMDTLKKKIESKDSSYKYQIERYDELFYHGKDSSGIHAVLSLFLSVFISFFLLLFLIILIISQFKCKKCRKYLHIILGIICIGMLIYCLYLGFDAKYEVDLKDGEIYIFDKEFNDEIRYALNFMLARKIILIIAPFLMIIGIIAQCVILFYFKNKLKRDNIEHNVDNGTNLMDFSDAK